MLRHVLVACVTMQGSYLSSDCKFHWECLESTKSHGAGPCSGVILECLPSLTVVFAHWRSCAHHILRALLPYQVFRTSMLGLGRADIVLAGAGAWGGPLMVSSF